MAEFPTLRSILNKAKETLSRFPLESLTAILGTVFAILLSEEKNDIQENFYVKAIMCCTLGLVLFLSVSLYSSARKIEIWMRFLISLILAGLVSVFIFSFSEKITTIEFLNYFVLNIAIHLLVSFSGFLPRAYNQDAFWEFNKQLFLRILTSGLYSAVLFGGLALAILAVANLFNVNFYNNIYIHMFFIIGGTFNTIFFLSGVPDTNNEKTPLVLNYPKGLKNFTQYVLLPLISIYLVILISYEAKILITFSLPIGWVSNLVLVFAIFGILSFLLVLPIAKNTENLWIRNFNRWFYYLLVPLLGLLFWAILYRIHLYGFTHERYYVLLLSIWLTVVVGYFIIQNQPKIKFIPISMCLAALFSIIGPQSADTISKNSQLSRFESYMQKTEKQKLTYKEEQDLSSIVDFLEDNYSTEILIPYTKDKLSALLKKDKSPNSTQIMKALGLEYRSKYENQSDNKTTFYYNFYNDNDFTIKNIHGYDFSFSISDNSNLECFDCIKIDQTTYTIQSTKREYGLDLQINQDTIPFRIVDFVNNNPAFDKNHSSEKIIQKIESNNYSILLSYRNMSGKREGKTKKIDQFLIDVLVRIKN